MPLLIQNVMDSVTFKKWSWLNRPNMCPSQENVVANSLCYFWKFLFLKKKKLIPLFINSVKKHTECLLYVRPWASLKIQGGERQSWFPTHPELVLVQFSSDQAQTDSVSPNAWPSTFCFPVPISVFNISNFNISESQSELWILINQTPLHNNKFRFSSSGLRLRLLSF